MKPLAVFAAWSRTRAGAADAARSPPDVFWYRGWRCGLCGSRMALAPAGLILMPIVRCAPRGAASRRAPAGRGQSLRLGNALVRRPARAFQKVGRRDPVDSSARRPCDGGAIGRRRSRPPPLLVMELAEQADRPVPGDHECFSHRVANKRSRPCAAVDPGLSAPVTLFRLRHRRSRKS